MSCKKLFFCGEIIFNNEGNENIILTVCTLSNIRPSFENGEVYSHTDSDGALQSGIYTKTAHSLRPHTGQPVVKHQKYIKQKKYLDKTIKNLDFVVANIL